MNLNADVAIVGGGLSGLALADRLERAGTDYTLLEARDRLGGRILSKVIDGAAFDLGPTWFWPVQPRMAALVNRLGLEVFDQFSDGAIVAEDQLGRVHRNAGFASMQGSYRIDGGLGRLTSGLAKNLPPDRVNVNVTVTSLTRESDGIVIGVDCDGKAMRISANRVVLALPPRIAGATIAFSPELPTTVRRALANIPTWMAGQAKILAVYDHPYWRDAGLSGDAMSHRGPMVEVHDASPARGGPYALFGFVGTPPGIRNRYRDETLTAAREQLGRLFGREMGNPKYTDFQDWSEDVLTATPADHESNGHHASSPRAQALDGVWEGHVLFAGSEAASQFGGYLEGALEAAEDVAERLITKSRV